MKKLFLPLILCLLLAGCSIKNYTPVIPIELNQVATVTTGDFSYRCEIYRNETCVKVKAITTNAQGLTMTYDGNDLAFNYMDMDYSIPAQNFEKTNPAIIIYDVYSVLENISVENISRLDNGFEYKGNIPLGEFIMVQDDSGKVKTLTFKSSDIVFTFE